MGAEADLAKSLEIEDIAADEDEGGLEHFFVDALEIQLQGGACADFSKGPGLCQVGEPSSACRRINSEDA